MSDNGDKLREENVISIMDDYREFSNTKEARSIVRTSGFCNFIYDLNVSNLILNFYYHQS